MMSGPRRAQAKGQASLVGLRQGAGELLWAQARRREVARASSGSDEEHEILTGCRRAKGKADLRRERGWRREKEMAAIRVCWLKGPSL